MDIWRFLGRRTKAAELSSQKIPTVKFDASRVTQTVEENIRSTLQSISEIQADDLDQTYDAAVSSVRAGGNLHLLYRTLSDLGLTKRRASEIATLVNRRATNEMDRSRQSELGITEAVWLHSGAPCLADAKKPSAGEAREDSLHKEVSGKRYIIKEGMFIDGRWVWPGEEMGCKCISNPVIPGFN
jgi:hypothetical protein